MRKLMALLSLIPMLCFAQFVPLMVNTNNGQIYAAGALHTNGIFKTLGVTNFTLHGHEEWAGGNTWRVPVDGNIGTYVSNAVAGDTLILASGTNIVSTYVTIDKELTIIGEGEGSQVEFLQSHAPGFYVTASNVRFINIAMATTGEVVCVSFDGTTGSVLTGCVVDNCDITHSNTGGQRRAVYFSDAAGRVSNTRISGGCAGVYISSAASAEIDPTNHIEHCRINVTGGNGENSRAVHVQSSSILTTNRCTVFDCQLIANDSGYAGDYGVYASLSEVTVIQSKVDGHDKDLYLNFAPAGLITVIASTLINNTTSGTIAYGGTTVSDQVHAYTRFLVAGIAGVTSNHIWIDNDGITNQVCYAGGIVTNIFTNSVSILP